MTRLDALIEPLDDGGCIVRSPRVGIYRGCPAAGERKSGGDPVGRLSVLGRTEELFLPTGVGGLVAGIAVHDQPAAVEYAQELFRLEAADLTMTGGAPPGSHRATPRSSAATVAGATGVAGAAGAAGKDEPLPAGCQAVRSPMDGIFYRGPAPGAAPFVRPGDVVEKGRTLGLIEAMKSFNAVAYGGGDLPSPAQVVEVRAGDCIEVRQGALLFVVKPA